MYYTTLCRIRKEKPCLSGWEKLLRCLGKTMPDNEPLSLSTILDSNGIQDAVWALRAVDDPACERDAHLFVIRCIRQAAQPMLHDPRSLNALDVAEMYAVGMATDSELQDARTAAREVLEQRINYESEFIAAQLAVKISDVSFVWRISAFYIANSVAEDDDNYVEYAGLLSYMAAKATAWKPIEQDFKEIFCS